MNSRNHNMRIIISAIPDIHVGSSKVPFPLPGRHFGHHGNLEFSGHMLFSFPCDIQIAQLIWTRHVDKELS